MKNMRQTMLAAVAAVAATIPVTAITPGRAVVEGVALDTCELQVHPMGSWS